MMKTSYWNIPLSPISRRLFSTGAANLPRIDGATRSFDSMVDREIKRFNGVISRNGGRSLIGWVLRNLAIVSGRVSASRVKLVCVFAFHVARILKNEGRKGLVQHLKTSHVLIQQAVGGYVVKDQTALKRRVRRSRSGLPLWLPVLSRRALLGGDVKEVRFWTSLVAIYRVVEYVGIPNLSSITSPGPVIDWNTVPGIVEVIQGFWKRLWSGKPDHEFLPSLEQKWRSTVFKPFPIGQSSPSASSWTDQMEAQKRVFHPISSSAYSVIRSARWWMRPKSEPLLNSMRVFLAGIPDAASFLGRLQILANPCRRTPEGWDVSLPLELHEAKLQTIGKLGFKDEPAGKVRVFAMVDPWTQWLMKPLHDLLFKILRGIPQDATFDQVGVLEKGLNRIIGKGFRVAKAFSYDLSSATDRLPVEIQVLILSQLLGYQQACAWAQLLVGRPYEVPSSRNEKKESVWFNFGPLSYLNYTEVENWLVLRRVIHDGVELSLLLNKKVLPEWTKMNKKDKERRIKHFVRTGNQDPSWSSEHNVVLPRFVDYAVGQPMGALSSWAMLAVSHHVIVQLAWWQVCKRKGSKYTWAQDYVVLGDDIVIFHPLLAERYYYIMNDLLDVKIGLAKSIQARKRLVLEFAKKYWVDGKRAFMLPVRDILVAQLSTAVLGEFIRKNELTFQNYLSIRGLGYRSKAKWTGRLWGLSSRLRVYIIMYLFDTMDWLDWIRLRNGDGTLYPLSRPVLIRICEILWSQRLKRVKSIDRIHHKVYDDHRVTQFEHETGIAALRAPIIKPGVFMFQYPSEVLDPSRHDDKGNWVSLIERQQSNLYDYLLVWNVWENQVFSWHNLTDRALLWCINDIRRTHEVWDRVYDNYTSPIGWLTQYRVEPKRFTRFLSIYKEWVTFNTEFVKASQGLNAKAVLRENRRLALIPIGEPYFVWGDYSEVPDLQDRYLADTGQALIDEPSLKRVTVEGEPQSMSGEPADLDSDSHFEFLKDRIESVTYDYDVPPPKGVTAEGEPLSNQGYRTSMFDLFKLELQWQLKEKRAKVSLPRSSRSTRPIKPEQPLYPSFVKPGYKVLEFIAWSPSQSTIRRRLLLRFLMDVVLGFGILVFSEWLSIAFIEDEPSPIGVTAEGEPQSSIDAIGPSKSEPPTNVVTAEGEPRDLTGTEIGWWIVTGLVVLFFVVPAFIHLDGVSMEGHLEPGLQAWLGSRTYDEYVEDMHRMARIANSAIDAPVRSPIFAHGYYESWASG